MQKKRKCKCGSSQVVYVVRKGRSKDLQAFCEKCLPVENDKTEKVLELDDHLKKN